MTRFLLDTNHASQIFKANAALQSTIKRRRGDEFGLCAPVLAELWFMIYNSRRVEENRKILESKVAEFNVWSLDAAATEMFGRLKVDLRRAGRTVADVDLQIGAIAVVNDLTLLTADTAFANIQGLRHENWLV